MNAWQIQCTSWVWAKHSIKGIRKLMARQKFLILGSLIFFNNLMEFCVVQSSLEFCEIWVNFVSHRGRPTDFDEVIYRRLTLILPYSQSLVSFARGVPVLVPSSCMSCPCTSGFQVPHTLCPAHLSHRSDRLLPYKLWEEIALLFVLAL